MSKPSEPFMTPAGVPRDHQFLWLSLIGEAWRSLAVVAVDTNTSTWELASALDKIAARYDLGSFKVIDAESPSTATGEALAEDLKSSVAQGVRTVAAVGWLLDGPRGFPLVEAAEAIVLLVRLGVSRAADVQAMAELVGRERVLGCVTVRGA